MIPTDLLSDPVSFFLKEYPKLSTQESVDFENDPFLQSILELNSESNQLLTNESRQKLFIQNDFYIEQIWQQLEHKNQIMTLLIDQSITELENLELKDIDEDDEQFDSTSEEIFEEESDHQQENEDDLSNDEFEEEEVKFNNEEEGVKEEEEDDNDSEEEFDWANDPGETEEYYYKDFFGSKPPPAFKSLEQEQNFLEKNLLQEEDDEYSDDGEEAFDEEMEIEEEEEGFKKELKSSFEKQQESIQEMTREMEEKLLEPKAWTMKGEVAANQRPKNSLLPELRETVEGVEDIQFDFASQPAPVVTEEKTMTLEDLIKQRILDQNYNDVERKLMPKTETKTEKERIEISTEKSKQSLSQLYEKEYQKQQQELQGQQEKEIPVELQKKYQDIQQMFQGLCQQLDLLTHLHYTPTLTLPASVPQTAPQLKLEQVAPTWLTTDAVALEEETKLDDKISFNNTHKPIQSLKSFEEKTTKDKQKDRLKKKKQKKQKESTESQPKKKEKKKSEILKDLVKNDKVQMVQKDGRLSNTEKKKPKITASFIKL